MEAPVSKPLPPRVFSVSELTARVRELLEKNLGLIWVEGEVSSPRHPPAGHLNFNHNHPKAGVKAVIFSARRRHLGFEPEEGMQVLAFGALTVYEPRGEYQLVIEHLEPLGAGALALAFEQLKVKLAREGLFDPERKKPLPILPRRVAVVTSPSGAALWDFLRIIKRRFPGLTIQIYPVPVQGEAAPGLIVRALTELNDLCPAPEVIVLTRGGGSLEDLWPFNTEVVARAVAASKIPVISAVGHEVDFTIADFAADVRAATPSNAAELLVRPKVEWLAEVRTWEIRLIRAAARRVETVRLEVKALRGRLIDPRRSINLWRLSLDDLIFRLDGALKRGFEARRSRAALLSSRLAAVSPRPLLSRLTARKSALNQALAWQVRACVKEARSRIGSAAERLEALSPLAVLGRGYSLTYDRRGRLVRAAATVKVDDRVSVRLKEGGLGCLVKEVKKRWSA